MKRPLPSAAELRRRAERRLRKQSGDVPSADELPRLVHELRVHQIQLEMQNEALRTANHEIEAGLERYTKLYELAPVGYFTLTRDGRIRHLNLAGAGILGAARSKLLGRDLGSHVAAESLPTFRNFLGRVFASWARESCELRFIAAGTARPVVGHVEGIGNEIAQDCNLAVTNITERKRHEDMLLEQATIDSLTGLPNRRHVMIRMEEELARMRRVRSLRAAVLMLDLDHFKRINDTFGHAVGDAVLRHFAAVVHGGLRNIDSVGRVGGEEFVVLLPGDTLAAARVFAERLRLKVADAPLALSGEGIPLTVSIGIAAMRATDVSVDVVLVRADEALYRAKGAGRNRVEVATGGRARKPRTAAARIFIERRVSAVAIDFAERRGVGP